MKYLQLIFILVCMSTVACTPKFIKQYEKDMVENPNEQLEKDKNIILQYLVDNKLNFETTESGIYYSIENMGTGENPEATSTVITHYKGYKLDGEVFDSSYERDEPLEFPLSNVIPGWQEVIPMLKIGGKGTFIIPSGLAYGERGAGANIAPNTVLIFDVELLDHYKPEDKAKRQAEKDQVTIAEHLNKNEMTAKKTESGLHYVIEKEGNGASPSATDVVMVHYKGSLMDGKVFDSSYDRGEPITFPLNRVIPGWQEAVPLLKEGGKGIFLIPSAIAYGERGAGADIPPNSVLSFEVELLKVMSEQDMQKMEAEKEKQAAGKSVQQAVLDEEIIRDYIAKNNLKAERTPEGLYYIVERAGTNPKPTIDSKVTVHYKGTTLDGKVFDSSYDRGQPATFPLRGVVKGWQIGIPQLGKGGKGKLIIPSGLAYGERGAGADIPPNAVLIFEVEVIEVN